MVASAFVSLFVLTLVQVALASRGDKDSRFQTCLSNCITQHASRDEKLPGHLLWTGWTWSDECKYTCMHEVVADDIRQGHEIEQYYGKWPFVRFMGIQEPASVVFSFANLVMYIICGLGYFKRVSKDDHMNSLLLFYTFTGINAWIWSCVFHIRDLYWTERLDYFSATLLTVTGTYLATIRVFEIRRNVYRLVLALAFAAFFVSHVSYLTLIKFDYGWNMTVNIAVSAVHGLLWISWFLLKRPAYGWRCMAVIVLMSLGMTLELLDFPPLWWTIDAHSLWHAWTVPIVPLWYSFWRADYNSRHSDTKGD